MYPNFELINKLYNEYSAKSKDGINYTSRHIEKNSSHNLYSGKYDRIYFSINYRPPINEEIYCKIEMLYMIDGNPTTVDFYYSEDNIMMCKFKGREEKMCKKNLYNILDSIIMEYIDYWF